jgi:hypothetical protein
MPASSFASLEMTDIPTFSAAGPNVVFHPTIFSLVLKRKLLFFKFTPTNPSQDEHAVHRRQDPVDLHQESGFYFSQKKQGNQLEENDLL